MNDGNYTKGLEEWGIERRSTPARGKPGVQRVQRKGGTECGLVLVYGVRATYNFKGSKTTTTERSLPYPELPSVP